MGQLRKRGAVWWIRYYRNGRRFEESAHTDKWETARDLLRNREGDIAKGVAVSAKIGRLRFEDAAADLVTDYRINAKKSIAHVERHVERLTKEFGGRRMSDISGADVRRYVEHRQDDGAANATINRELSSLRRMFTLAIDAGKLIAKPKIRLLQEDNARQGFFEREHFAAVLKRLPAPLQAVATLAYWSGWRRGELLGAPARKKDRAIVGEWQRRPLEWCRVDRQAQIIRLDVGTTKNKDGREFNYGAIDDVRAMIERQWAEHEALKKQTPAVLCPFVFHRKGKPIKSFRKAWNAACKAAGCPGRLLHDCRRTTVRNLERAGVSRSVAMKLTGHKTEAVYRRYAIVSSMDLADAARKLQAMTGTISGTIDQNDKAAESAKATA